MTIEELYHKQDAGSYSGLDQYVGRKVRHIVYQYENLKEAVESWSETVHIIESYDDDLCGDGCCSGFKISDSGTAWNSYQLKVVES